MANLRDIRNRINSVNNTQQITKAMKMVAAAKLRKAQNRMTANRPYAYKMEEIVGRLVNNTNAENILLRVPEEIDRLLFIIVGSDRGLCGAFNNNLFKQVEETLKDQYREFLENDAIDLVCIGKKSEAHFKKRDYNVIESYPGFFDNLEYEEAVKVMERIRSQFVDGSYGSVFIAFNEFKSVIAQTRIIDQVLPIDPEQLVEELDEDDSETVIDYIYEPGSNEILEKILPRHLNIRLWTALLESNAAEQGARMAAMDNATENAKELESELRLKYNRARQSAITTEISEIVSGAQALEED